MESRKSLYEKMPRILNKILLIVLPVIVVITILPTLFITGFLVKEGIDSVRTKINVEKMGNGEEFSIHARTIVSKGKELDIQSEIERVCKENDLIGKYTAYADEENIEFESIVIYPDTYYVLNTAADDFNDGLTKLNEDGFRGDMFSTTRYIYLPIFAKTAEGEEIIATEKMYFHKDNGKILSQDGSYSDPYFSFNSFSQMKNIITQYEAEDFLWVSVSTEHHPYTMPLLILKTDGEYNVLDYAGILEYMSDPTLYSPDDYVEKKEAKDNSIIQANKRAYLYPRIFVISTPIVCISSFAFYLVLLHGKNKSSKDTLKQRDNT